MDTQCKFLSFLLIFGMVTSKLSESIHAQEDLLEKGAVPQSLHNTINKIQQTEGKAQEKLLKIWSWRDCCVRQSKQILKFSLIKTHILKCAVRKKPFSWLERTQVYGSGGDVRHTLLKSMNLISSSKKETKIMHFEHRQGHAIPLSSHCEAVFCMQ